MSLAQGTRIGGRYQTGAAMVLVLAAVASQVIALLVWGHVKYLWVQGVEALVAAAGFAAFAIRYRNRDPRPGRWPPLLPLAAIALTGGVKDLLVALDRPTPAWLVVALICSVIWFAASSWFTWRSDRALKAR